MVKAKRVRGAQPRAKKATKGDYVDGLLAGAVYAAGALGGLAALAIKDAPKGFVSDKETLSSGELNLSPDGQRVEQLADGSTTLQSTVRNWSQYYEALGGRKPFRIVRGSVDGKRALLIVEGG